MHMVIQYYLMLLFFVQIVSIADHEQEILFYFLLFKDRFEMIYAGVRIAKLDLWDPIL